MTRKELWDAYETAQARRDTEELKRLAVARRDFSSSYRHPLECWCGLCRALGEPVPGLEGEKLVAYAIKVPAALRDALKGKAAKVRAALEIVAKNP